MAQDPDELRLDEQWYLLAHPDVAAAGLGAAEHFRLYGEAEGRSPSPRFDAGAYLAAHPDVEGTGLSPVAHWRERGRTDGHQAIPWLRGPGAPLGAAELGRLLAGRSPPWQRALVQFHHPRLLRLGDEPDALIRVLVALGSGDRTEPALRELLDDALDARAGSGEPRVRVVVGPGDPVAVLVTSLGLLADPASAAFDLAPGSGGGDPSVPEVRLPAGSWPAPGLVDRLVDDTERYGRDQLAVVPAVPLELLGDAVPATARRDPDLAELVQLVGEGAAPPARRALVVEAGIPTPDRDSGSLSTMQYARALRRLGYDVELLVLHDQGGADSQRRALELEGFAVRTEPGPWYDVALVMRAGGFRAVAPALRPRVRLLVYVAVDLHHLRVTAQSEVEGRDEVAAAAAELAAVELANVDLADLTLVNSLSELGYLREVAPGARVAHAPMARPVAAYRRSDDERDDELVFVGGFLHEPNLDAVVWFLDEVWPVVAAALPAAHLGVYGADLPAAVAARSDERVRFHGHVPTLADAFARARLSVVPLRFGAGVKGKLVSSLVHGVPVVSTPVGVEGLDLPGDAVTVATDAPSFARAVVGLWADRGQRERQRRRGYDVARERFTLETLVSRLGELLDGRPEAERSVDPVAGLGPQQAEQVGEGGDLGG